MIRVKDAIKSVHSSVTHSIKYASLLTKSRGSRKNAPNVKYCKIFTQIHSVGTKRDIPTYSIGETIILSGPRAQMINKCHCLSRVSQ